MSYYHPHLTHNSVPQVCIAQGFKVKKRLNQDSDPDISVSRSWAPDYSIVLGLLGTELGFGGWGAFEGASLGEGTNTHLSAGQEDQQHMRETWSIETSGYCRIRQRGTKDYPRRTSVHTAHQPILVAGDSLCLWTFIEKEMMSKMRHTRSSEA